MSDRGVLMTGVKLFVGLFFLALGFVPFVGIVVPIVSERSEVVAVFVVVGACIIGGVSLYIFMMREDNVN